MYTLLRVQWPGGGEQKFTGRGVSYCVDCDANFYRGATVIVVGNRSAAIDGALTMLGYADRVDSVFLSGCPGT